jgi:hypothetical protein
MFRIAEYRGDDAAASLAPVVGKSFVARDPLGGVSSAYVVETFITAPPAREGNASKAMECTRGTV